MALPKRGEAYRCARCGARCVATTDELVATAESERTFGATVTAETHDVVCDVCWEKIVAWYNAREGGTNG